MLFGVFSDKARGLIFLLALFAVSFQACSPENEYKMVDFGKTTPGKPSAAGGTETDIPLKFAIGAMISPQATFVHYRELLDYVGRKLSRSVELVQRKTYQEISVMLDKGEVDLAFICSGPYFSSRETLGFQAIATPEIRGSHYYQSYLIVNASSAFQDLQDLKGRVFAFTDPDSLTGKLVPTYWLAQMNTVPEAFFGKIIYTYSHDNSILAVGKGLVDGAAVDSLVWDYFAKTNPAWTSKTRIIKKSDFYGIPPLVVSQHIPADVGESLKKVLLFMHEDPQGREILAGLMIDRFTAPSEQWYASMKHIEERMQDLVRQSDAPQDTPE